MFNGKFIEELFRPQELYPKKAVKHIFEKVAHSSIMRLNEASMDKVCDSFPIIEKQKLDFIESQKFTFYKFVVFIC
jgi:hypothetical protein